MNKPPDELERALFPDENWDAPAKDIRPTVSSSIAFVFVCPACHKVGRVNYDAWSVYKGLVECGGCEKGFIVKEPWK